MIDSGCIDSTYFYNTSSSPPLGICSLIAQRLEHLPKVRGSNPTMYPIWSEKQLVYGLLLSDCLLLPAVETLSFNTHGVIGSKLTVMGLSYCHVTGNHSEIMEI